MTALGLKLPEIRAFKLRVRVYFRFLKVTSSLIRFLISFDKKNNQFFTTPVTFPTPTASTPVPLITNPNIYPLIRPLWSYLRFDIFYARISPHKTQ